MKHKYPKFSSWKLNLYILLKKVLNKVLLIENVLDKFSNGYISERYERFWLTYINHIVRKERLKRYKKSKKKSKRKRKDRRGRL